MNTVFNLTDVPTDELTRRGLVNQTIVIGSTAIAPGTSAQISDEPHITAQLRWYLDVGAVAEGQLPSAYAHSKALQQREVPLPAPPSPPPIPVEAQAPEPEPPPPPAAPVPPDPGADTLPDTPKSKGRFQASKK
jgi:hypothetical protein